VLQSHIFQRKDGSILIGGGYLEVGGAGSSKTEPSSSVPRAKMLFDKGCMLALKLMNDSEVVGAYVAVRPMPQDGLPAAGFLDEGIFAIVTHSGFTLSPILAPLVAAELVRGVDLELLDEFRPVRFALPQSLVCKHGKGCYRACCNL